MKDNNGKDESKEWGDKMNGMNEWKWRKKEMNERDKWIKIIDRINGWMDGKNKRI